ncbi:putative signal transducing protein [Pseudozobellia thermophila]|uniref:Putative signal transducing protein n=1 Tax=Pseudozobellia thermophila TaxID=192903 RepID=A0A1M6MKW3_9FLAO|nr:DUF2007 domain-containing protein [Pseudozobellia thermophila]SHJ84092.1 Putative signal transducing protein [Pseudozobellia thermophila]
MGSNYLKIYSGNRFTAQQIENKLKEIGISAILKDESESARLAGFAANMDGELEVHVHRDEHDRAMAVIRSVLGQKED